MEGYSSMVGWYWYYCHGYNFMPIMNVGGMQLFKISTMTHLKKFFLNQKRLL